MTSDYCPRWHLEVHGLLPPLGNPVGVPWLLAKANLQTKLGEPRSRQPEIKCPAQKYSVAIAHTTANKWVSLFSHLVHKLSNATFVGAVKCTKLKAASTNRGAVAATQLVQRE